MNATIDNRSHAVRSLDLEPGQHRGPDRQERQARRAFAQQERDAMPPREPLADQDLPVPDPDGTPIHPLERQQAEDRILETLQGVEPPAQTDQHGLEEAQAALDAQSAREMSEDEAQAYRLAPEGNLLDWIDEPAPEPVLDGRDLWQEPDRDRR